MSERSEYNSSEAEDESGYIEQQQNSGMTQKHQQQITIRQKIIYTYILHA